MSKRVILRPGHGLTFSKTRRVWTLQRPGNKEDDWTAMFCGNHLIPALVTAGIDVFCLRAIHPVTGVLDCTPTTVDSNVLHWLDDRHATTQPRWYYNASVEGALQGNDSCANGEDPEASCRWEASIPNEADEELYLSIHQNWVRSPRPYGFLALHSPSSTAGRRYAQHVFDAVADEFANDGWGAESRTPFGARSTGSAWNITGRGLIELGYTRRPAVLLELGFMSNARDRHLMSNSAWRTRMAEAIAHGLS